MTTAFPQSDALIDSRVYRLGLLGFILLLAQLIAVPAVALPSDPHWQGLKGLEQALLRDTGWAFKARAVQALGDDAGAEPVATPAPAIATRPVAESYPLCSPELDQRQAYVLFPIVPRAPPHPV